MKTSFFKKASRFIAAALSAAMCLTLAPINAFAQDNADNEIKVVMDYDFSRDVVMEKYKELDELSDDDFDNLQLDIGVVPESGIMPQDGYPPTSYHNLENSDYAYKGYSERNRLFSSKYFSTTGDGYLYFEGFSKTFHTTSGAAQDFNFEIWSRSSNKCVATFSIDDRNVLSRGERYSTFYYHFCVYNLNPNELYYIAFTDKTQATGFEAYGYVSHDWTNYWYDDPRYDF